MDLLKSTFLESPLLLGLVAAVAMAVAMSMHRRRQTAASRRGLGITVGVLVLLFVVQAMVKTDREQIAATVTAIARAIDEGDVAGVGEHLDSGFQDRGLDKTEWLADLRQRLQRWQIDAARVGGFVVQVQGDEATVSFRATCDWRNNEQSQSGVMSQWKLEFVHGADGWKLRRVLNAKFGPGGLLDYPTILTY